MSASDGDRMIVGGEEWAALSDLNIPAIKVRVDSGAKTSALHAYNIKTQMIDDKEMVFFDLHPVQSNRTISVSCSAEVVDKRLVRSSSGQSEKRIVIATTITLGDQSWPIEVTLTGRDTMGYRMLLGRQAMAGRTLIDPDSSFLTRQLSDAGAKGLYQPVEVKERSLRIAVLATNPELYSNRRLMEAGRERGHEMIFVNAAHCYMNINSNQPTIHYRGGEALENLDGVIPRLRPSLTFYGCAVARQMQAMGAFILNEPACIALARDKLLSTQVLASKGLRMPTTGFASSPQETRDLIKIAGGAPLVVKLLEGTQGKGVVLAETTKAAESVINAFKSLKAHILVQEFIKEANGRDLRCFVVDGKVVGAMERVAAEGEFRANLHLGGISQKVKLTAEEKKLSIAAARCVGLKVAGVDLIRSGSGPMILEVNSSPGLEGIEKTTSLNIAGMMVECIEKYVLGKSKTSHKRKKTS